MQGSGRESLGLGRALVSLYLTQRSTGNELYIFASNLGTMKRQFDECVEFVKSRKQFDRPISEFQAVSHKIADMRVHIELAELLLYKIGWLKKEDVSSFFETAMAKLFISE